MGLLRPFLTVAKPLDGYRELKLSCRSDSSTQAPQRRDVCILPAIFLFLHAHSSAMRLGCCLPLALLLLCTTAASASYAGALTNLPVGLGNLLEQEQPQCLNVLSVCKAACDEQLLKGRLHKPLAGVEAIDRFYQVSFYLLLMIVAVLVAVNIQTRRQLARSAWQFHKLEAHLRHSLQGMKDQAFDYAQKLEGQTPRQAARSQAERRQQRDVRSPTPDVNSKVWLCVPAPAAPAHCQVHSLYQGYPGRMLARISVRPPDQRPCAGSYYAEREC